MSTNNLFLLLALLSIVACAPKNLQKIEFARTGEVKCTKYERDVIEVNSKARALTLAEATVYAERNAIENLLFKGIPNSNQENALVEDEYESLQNNASFYDHFIMQRAYEKFIMESYVASSDQQKGVATVYQHVEVDLEGMRRHLEKNKIIRKFGL